MSPKRKQAHHRREHECDSARWTTTELPAGSGAWLRPAMADSSAKQTLSRGVVEMHALVTPEAVTTAALLLSTDHHA